MLIAQLGEPITEQAWGPQIGEAAREVACVEQILRPGQIAILVGERRAAQRARQEAEAAAAVRHMGHGVGEAPQRSATDGGDSRERGQGPCRPIAAIPGENLIAPIAVQDHLPMGARGLRDEVGGHRARVPERLAVERSDGGDGVQRRDMQRNGLETEMHRGAAGRRSLAQRLVGHFDDKAQQIPGAELRRVGSHQATVDSAGQKHADGHIAAEAQCHGLPQPLIELLHGVGAAAAERRRPCRRPVWRDSRGLAGREGQRAARRQRENAFIDGFGVWDKAESQVVRQGGGGVARDVIEQVEQRGDL